MSERRHNHGFTLIELSIVLVVIGLIVGGILVGQSLIAAAQVRATVTQIEKYNQAANTFFEKYGFLPGDIPAGPATQFGFIARGTSPGQGDGNGIMEGIGGGGTGWGWVEGGGETAAFWVDLSTARLIDGGFSTASPSSLGSTDVTGSNLALWLPQAKIGNGNYVYVWSTNNSNHGSTNNYPSNYFGISAVSNIANSSNGGKVTSTPGVTVAQAAAIDTKLDDGLPFSGSVQAVGLSNDPVWSTSRSWGGDVLNTSFPTGSNLAANSSSCADNGNNASNTTRYSIEVSNGANVNCALSFKFQAGD
jgi:prepilin-type N-terminal cleavage/methylation domain-containing protein